MSRPPTLPTRPLPHPAMDFATLRAEGIKLLGKLGGRQWTDYNAHDPGITILEVLHYALADLAYRADFSVEDLLNLSGEERERDLPAAQEILTVDATTAADLRRLAVDVEGALDASVEVDSTPELAVYPHPSGELRLVSGPGADTPLVVRGLSRVRVRGDSDERKSQGLGGRVARRLHAERGLCTDLSVSVLATRNVRLHAEIEVGPTDDPEGLLAKIFEQVERHLAPRLDVEPLHRALKSKRVDEIYEGPKLRRGLVEAIGGEQARPRSVRTSDVIHVLSDLPEVLAVRSIGLSLSAQRKVDDEDEVERSELDLPAEVAPTLDLGSDIRLFRAGLRIQVDANAAADRYGQRRAPSSPADAETLGAPAGRDRNVAAYRSIRSHFPALYGIGPLGLAASAPVSRRARAKQLSAYLLLFDQLLANQLAQLAHVGRLFSFGEGSSHTYAAGHVNATGLDSDGLVAEASEDHARWLAKEVAPSVDDDRARKHRLLNHLLARFSEQLEDRSQLSSAPGPGPEGEPTPEAIANKQAFLTHYPSISSGRGSGPSVYDPASHFGFAERIRLRLGLGDDDFVVVEHVLLRPVPEDAGQIGDEAEGQVPLLDTVGRADPYSHQLSFVFKARGDDEAYEQLVEQTVIAETPAHLTPYLQWFSDDEQGNHWSGFVADVQEWRACYAAYRTGKLLTGSVALELHLPLRDARDRLIDRLQLGGTYPLRDLPLPSLIVVTHNVRDVKVQVPWGQRGVRYQLCDHRRGLPVAGSKSVVGTAAADADADADATIELKTPPITVKLKTPPITEDAKYRIRASKGEREVYLLQQVTVKVGLDVSLPAAIAHGEEDPGVVLLAPQFDGPRDPRLVDHGGAVKVSLPESQEGVDYDVIAFLRPGERAPDDPEWLGLLEAAPSLSLDEEPVIGTGHGIELRTREVTEDVDLGIRVRKALGPNDETDFAQLDALLPLKVRAARRRERIAATVEPTAIVAYGATPTVRLEATQQTAEYRVHARPIYDREFDFQQPPGVEVVAVPTEGEHVAQVVRPAHAAVWQALERLQPVSAFVSGNGAALDLSLGELTRDIQCVIEARKQHVNGPLDDAKALDSNRVLSSVQLEAAPVVLVRPNPGSSLAVRAWFDGQRVRFEASQGQPGVLYGFGDDLGVAFVDQAYFHKRDDDDPTLNKGVGQLRMEGDLVVARGRGGDTREELPPWPLLETDRELDVGSLEALAGKSLTVKSAQKVISRVSAEHRAVAVVVHRRDRSVELVGGIGAATAARLAKAGVRTLGELAAFEPGQLIVEGVGAARLQVWSSTAVLLIAFERLQPSHASLLAELGVASPAAARARLAAADAGEAELSAPQREALGALTEQG